MEISVEYCIAKAVWEGQIDGWQTSDVANEFGISTRQALKMLNKIISGANSDFGFVREEFYDGVVVKDGRTFAKGNNPDWQCSGKGLQHFIWFYT